MTIPSTFSSISGTAWPSAATSVKEPADLRTMVNDARIALEKKEERLNGLKNEETFIQKRFDDNFVFIKKEARRDKWLGWIEKGSKALAVMSPGTMAIAAVTRSPITLLGTMVVLGACFIANRKAKSERAAADYDFYRAKDTCEKDINELNRLKIQVASAEPEVSRMRSLYESLRTKEAKAIEDTEKMAELLASEDSGNTREIIDSGDFVSISGIKLEKSKKGKFEKIDVANYLEKLRKAQR